MYKIVIDSCGELPEDLKKDGHYQNVSLELEVDGCCIRDDETFDQKDFLRRVKESVTGPKSACPSPDEYMKSYEGDADHVYVVTLSADCRDLITVPNLEKICLKRSIRARRRSMYLIPALLP